MELLRNIGILFVLQSSIYILPLVVTPYLTRVLGVQSFGELGVSAGLIGFASIIVEWGFGLSGTRDVAKHHADPEQLTRIFWEVMTAKTILGLGALLLLNGVLIQLPPFQHTTNIVLLYEVQILGVVLNCEWFLRGLERMGWLTAASLIGRLSTIPLIFSFVKSSDDTPIAALLQGAAFLVSGLASALIVARRMPVGGIILDLKAAIYRIKDAASLFVSTAGISMYMQSNVLIVGLVCGAFEAGLFSGADRIRRGIQGLSGPISGAVFPRVNKLLAMRSGATRRLLSFFLLAQLSGMLALSIAMYWFAPVIADLFLGAKFSQAASVIRCFSPIPALVGISDVLGTNIMIPLGMNRQFMFVTLASGLFNVFALTLLASIYGAAGGALAVSATEAVVTASMAYLVLHNLHRLPAAKRQPGSTFGSQE